MKELQIKIKALHPATGKPLDYGQILVKEEISEGMNTWARARGHLAAALKEGLIPPGEEPRNEQKENPDRHQRRAAERHEQTGDGPKVGSRGVTVGGELLKAPEYITKSKQGKKIGDNGVTNFYLKITHDPEGLFTDVQDRISCGVWGDHYDAGRVEDVLFFKGEVGGYEHSESGKTVYTLKSCDIVDEDAGDSPPPDYGPEDDVPF